jgi:hypothetical protein
MSRKTDGRWSQRIPTNVPPLTHRARTNGSRFCRRCVRDGANYLAPIRAACSWRFCMVLVYVCSCRCAVTARSKRPLFACNFAPNFGNFMVGFLRGSPNLPPTQNVTRISEMQRRNTISPCRLAGVDLGLVGDVIG